MGQALARWEGDIRHGSIIITRLFAAKPWVPRSRSGFLRFLRGSVWRWLVGLTGLAGLLACLAAAWWLHAAIEIRPAAGA
jgi:hypothetical protein